MQMTDPRATGLVAFEFYGCLFHGHPKCKQRSMKDPWGRSMGERFQQTLMKEKYLQSEGFYIIRKWECEFREEIRNNPQLQAFMEDNNFLKPPIKPRRGFFGGRVNAAKLYYTIAPKEKIRYYDFTSLYPFVNMYRGYPVGAPKIIKYNFGDIRRYFGICQVTMLPPRELTLHAHSSNQNILRAFGIHSLRHLCRTTADNALLFPFR